MATSQRAFVVFYAWQSDLPEKSNRYLVRDALQAAAKRLKEKLPPEFNEVVIDEATRNLPGSPNIPAAIQQKILEADAVVCDVSTVLRSVTDGRQRSAPNPNVVFELGFAVANHGWERLIMILNEEHGVFEELPFDFDRHRAVGFRCAGPEQAGGASPAPERRDARTAVSELAYRALLSIIEHHPPRPADLRGVPAEEIKRRHDVAMLSDLFRTINWNVIDEFVASAPKYYAENILHFQAGFSGHLNSTLFYLYDTRAGELATKFSEAWDKVLRIAAIYVTDTGQDRFVWAMLGDLPFKDAREQQQWERARDAVREMSEAGNALIQHVRENYPEINIKETSEEAWREFKEYRQRREQGE